MSDRGRLTKAVMEKRLQPLIEEIGIVVRLGIAEFDDGSRLDGWDRKGRYLDLFAAGAHQVAFIHRVVLHVHNRAVGLDGSRHRVHDRGTIGSFNIDGGGRFLTLFIEYLQPNVMFEQPAPVSAAQNLVLNVYFPEDGLHASLLIDQRGFQLPVGIGNRFPKAIGRIFCAEAQ